MTGTQTCRRGMQTPTIFQGLIVCVCLAVGATWHIGTTQSRRQEAGKQLHSLTDYNSAAVTHQANRSQHACSWVNLNRPTFPLRKKLMIIIYETMDRKGRQETQHVIDNVSKYCHKHGYLFKLHHYVTDEAVGLFGTRWTETLKFWHMADWLLVLDSDTVVANLENSMDIFLNGPEHVLLHWRPNREVAAGVVAVRTTPFGKCFLHRWLSVIQTQMMLGRETNADNGALLLLVAEFVAPAVAQKCAGNKFEPLDLIRCYEAANKNFGDVPSADVPIRILPPLSGFWRQHEGVVHDAPAIKSCYDQQTVETMVYRRCWSNDIFISGWKAIGQNMWPEIGSQDKVAKCTFNTVEDELKLASLCCLRQFPGCHASNGKNLCANALCHSISNEFMQSRADLGFGICRFVGYDTQWSQVPGLTSC